METTQSEQPVYVLGIDLGGGGPKVGLVDESGRVVASASRSTRTVFLPNGGAEQDAEDWWRQVSEAAKEAIRLAGLPPAAIRAVSVTSMWSVIVPIDEQGDPLMPALYWMDTRGAPYNQKISGGFPTIQGYELRKLIRWIDLVGIPPTLSGVDALGHILFIKHERPEIYRKTYKFLEPMDFINLRLTGRCVATQTTLVPYLLTDNRTQDCKEYHPWLLQASGVERSKLPDILPIDATLGKLLPSIAQDWGLSPDTIVVASSNDNHTAAIGCGGTELYDGVAVLGTSGFMTVHVPAKKTDVAHMLATLPCPLPERYLVFADTGCTGKVLESVLYNLLFAPDELDPNGSGKPPKDIFERLEKLASSVPAGSEGVLFLPWLNGSLAPQEDSQMRGGFLNISHHTRRANMARAVLEGITYHWRWLSPSIERFTGHPFTHLRVAGGGAQSPTWCQIMADITGLPMQQLADPRNANVIGAAFLGFNRLGLLPLEDIPSKVHMAKIYHPQEENRVMYDRMFAQFMATQRSLRPVFHALHRI